VGADPVVRHTATMPGTGSSCWWASSAPLAGSFMVELTELQARSPSVLLGQSKMTEFLYLGHLRLEAEMPGYPAPSELRRRRGRIHHLDFGGRNLPDPGPAATLPAAEKVPAPPADLGAAGHAMWLKLWEGCDWISRDADRDAVAKACRLADDMEIARCRATRTGDARDRRRLGALSRELGSELAVLSAAGLFIPQTPLRR
jgi:hypothetical protein